MIGRAPPGGRFSRVADGGGASPIFTSTYGLAAFSDCTPSYYTVNGTTYVSVVEASGESFIFTTSDFVSFAPVMQNAGIAVPLLSASGGTTAIDSNYAGLSGSVFDPNNPGSLLWIEHADNRHQWDGGQVWTQVQLVTQSGIGYAGTMTRRGPIITSYAPKPVVAPPSGITGAGVPCVIVVGPYTYCFYMDYGPGDRSVEPFRVSVARALTSGGLVGGTWYKYYNGTWDEPGLGGMSSSLVLSHDVTPADTACPSVTWNTALRKYVMTYTCGWGYMLSTSTDLINWSAPLSLHQFDYDPGNWTPTSLLCTPGLPQYTSDQNSKLWYAYLSAGDPVPYTRELVFS